MTMLKTLALTCRAMQFAFFASSVSFSMLAYAQDPNVFTVNQGGAPNIQISIAGFPQLRAGLLETCYVLAENRGNDDSGIVRIWVAFPDNLQWQSVGVQPSSIGDMNGNTYLAFDISPALGGNVPIPFLLAAPFNSYLAHKPFQISAWVNQQ
ncbi:hypothetical protein EDE15_3220 [Edaphobacter aggregans]|uniref:Uncharacterized protein n=1 Tax=Edaphobacter aggregans TaxID=570835 RepID=A0A3R9NVG6_9BACT|nr:hypothetical protein [Edaphobacter aggregans]RSL17682.1 hypothetical protein EDE15_3220 [Edaphobacter aggregans]